MTKNNLVKYFSIITGEVYDIPSDFEKILDNYQLKMISSPNSSCKECYGRFYNFYNPKLKIYNVCPKCAVKCLSMDDISELNIETPSTTNELEMVTKNPIKH
jgi:predicted Zn-ribbon and HTH transcriptional regulator